MGLDIFLCARRSLTLSTVGCSRLFISANGPKRPEAYEGRSACVACPVGHFHTTGLRPNPMTILAEALRLICPRCGRPGETLINGTLCRCCHARHLEAAKRKDSRGRVPSLSGRIHTQRLAVGAGSFAPRVLTQRGVVGVSEAIIHHAKSASAPTAFGRRRVVWPRMPQLELGI